MKVFLKSIARNFLNFFRIYFNKKYLNALKSLPSGGELTLVDIGAAGDIEPRWKPFTEFINYIGFEPDERSRKQLLSNKNSFTKTFKILPYAVWDSSKKIDFNLTQNPETSSVYKPNETFLEKFPNSQRFRVERKISIDVKKIDDLNLPEADFIKIDIQGGELNSLIGAQNFLEGIFGLELEIEFLTMYNKQPLFGDVSSWLAKKKFEFIDFTRLVRWERKEHSELGQCIFGDALFLKSPEFVLINNLNENKICAYLSILLIYRRFDLIDISMEILSNYNQNVYYNFFQKVKKLKNINKTVRTINNINMRTISLFGYNYKSHLLY